MYLRQRLDIIPLYAAVSPTSYFVSLYFLNASKRNLAFMRYTLNLFDKGLAMCLSSNLKDVFLKCYFNSYEIIIVCPFPFLLLSVTNHLFGTPIILL
jgi:hypothetical protein